MFVTAAKLALIATLLVLFAPSADAQSVHPRCANAKDKVKCNCVLQNGGYVYHRPGGSPRVTLGTMGSYERYIACMQRNGRPNG